jgi:hypothetical protein
MAENTLALMDFLSSHLSPLPNLAEKGVTPPTTVYFSYLGIFLQYSAFRAVLLYSILLLAAVVLTKRTFVKIAPALPNGDGLIRTQFRGLSASTLGLFGAVIGANITAAIMRVSGHSLSWFSHEYLCIALYAPPALAGM